MQFIEDGTNIGDINLTTRSSTSTAGASSTGTRVSLLPSKARFGFAVLQFDPEISFKISTSGSGGSNYLANVNEASHEVLVAERIHCMLSLLPRCIFHNPMRHALGTIPGDGKIKHAGNSPAALQIPDSRVPTRQPNSPSK